MMPMAQGSTPRWSVRVTATQALGGNSSRVVVESTGSLRYDLYAGRVTVNDLWTMTPFADQFWRVSAAGVLSLIHI